MFTRSAHKVNKFSRSVIITTHPGAEKYIDNDILKVGYRKDAEPYDSKVRVNTMDLKYTEEWLNQIERAHRGFEHSNNTYYGYESEESRKLRE